MRIILIAVLFVAAIGLAVFLLLARGGEVDPLGSSPETVASDYERDREASRNHEGPVTFSPSEEAPVTVEDDPEEATTEKGPCRLWFEILDARARPAAGVTLQFGPAPPSLRRQANPLRFSSDVHELPSSTWRGRAVTTDRQGRLDLRELPAGNYLLYADGDEGLLIWQGSVSKPAAESRFLNPRQLSFLAARRFTIAVRDTEGNPIADCLVGLSSPDDETGAPYAEMMRRLGAGFAHGKTKAEGKTTIVVKRSNYYRTIHDSSLVDVFVPRFGGKLQRERFTVEGSRVDLSVTIPRPATAHFLGRDVDLPLPFLIQGGNEAWSPPGRIRKNTPPNRRLDRFLHVANGWRIEHLARGDRIANFEPGALCSLTWDSAENGFPHRVLEVPPRAEPFDVDPDLGKTVAGADESAEAKARLRVRLQLADGSPIDLSSFTRVLTTRAGEDLATTIEESGPDGSLLISVPAGASADLLLGDPFDRRSWRRDRAEAPPTQRRPFGPLNAGETVELAPVIFDPAPILAQGRLVDEQGRPLADRGLSLKGPEPPRGVSAFATFRAYGRSDSDGRFTILGRYPLGDPLTLSVSLGLAAAPQKIRAGDRDLTVVASPPGRLFGWIAADDPQLLRDLRLTLVHDDHGKKGHVLLRGNGSFTSFGLTPGPYTLTAFVGIKRVLAQHRFEIAPGADARPEALQGWNLFADWVMGEIRVVDADDAPVADVFVNCSFERDEETVREHGSTDARGIARFRVPRAAPVDVRVSTPGLRAGGRRMRSSVQDGARLPLTIRIEVEAKTTVHFGNLWPDDAPVSVELAFLTQLTEGAPWRQWTRRDHQTGLGRIELDGTFASKPKVRVALLRARRVGEPRLSLELPEHLVLVESAAGTDGDLSLEVPASEEFREKVARFLREHYPAK